MKKDTSRQIRIPGPRDHDVAAHCRKNGMRPEDERKMLRLLGKHAPMHEIHSNSPPRAPRFR
ncbi:hypothetical protein PMI07_004819 [Rhizobium sp. CF080]|uniref:hypothetical protein n=1 Tax=Rhizobium sp. (strain CF080) TaxID=1144310 RepID=UPI000271CD0C|nr:hypothetical protein [Rhizobium sp. CF080]EUB98538.1 hypothetical protein PMI07_004819 [Rhizobium sp. CF080]